MLEKHIIEQLSLVVEHYPLWPGDTLSHSAARECELRGWIVRAGGDWIPTAKGLEVYEWHKEKECTS